MCQEAFGQVQSTIVRMLELKQSVGSLEHLNQEMAEEATRYLFNRPVPPAAEEGQIIVASALRQRDRDAA